MTAGRGKGRHVSDGARRGRHGRGERAMVPELEVTSYYGRPVIKKPVWKSPDVPAYFFLGGLAGASGVMAALADATGRPRLARVGKVGASSGALAGMGALIHDLGRPERFLNMLRVMRPTSPLSMGSWMLATFGTLSSAAAASAVTGVLPRVGRVAGAGSAVIGPALSTYTANLISNTAVPVWHEAYPYLPFVFAGSSAASAGGLGLLAAPLEESGPARRMAVLGAAVENGMEQVMERRLGMIGEPYHQGRVQRFMRVGRALSAAGVVGALVGGRSRALSAISGLALLGGSLAVRFGVFEAGYTSALDPKYTIAPQRERVEARERVR